MTQLKLRKQFFPRAISDIAAFTFLIFMLPFCYWFEVFVVLPTRHAPGITFWYSLYIVWFTFLLISIVSNLTYIILTDCSIRGEVMPSTLVPPWKFCDLCQCVTPPRSWHCEVCKVCILKRDHHCHFSGCCIGHNNQRFFFMFLIYMTIATVHTTILNACFVIERESLSIWLIIKILFPLAVFTLGMDASFEDNGNI
ncbi:putative palmitoyltransferase ZDHHC24 isoform X2 [Lycorma delicatula]|uniref:putative palmitoyltransferase ZDHHC24 isoform X2 n=1 Tax=Lycorma delicatula TaxID=130591 RepID=UPI003F50E638